MTDQEAMELAITLARKAADAGETPIGCVVLDAAGTVIGRGGNRREMDCDPTAHAEIVALRQAAAHLGSWRLEGASVIVTLEPCPMCAGAIVNARAARLVYGAADPKAGAARTLYNLCDDPRLNHRLIVSPGLLSEECAKLLQDFFKSRRPPARQQKV